MVLNYNLIKPYKGQIFRLIILIIVIIVAWSFSNSSPTCDFALLDVEEYKGKNGDHFYINYEGVIRNNSDRDEYLYGLVAKVYNQDDILVTEGYPKVNKLIKSKTAIPFSIYTGVRDTPLVRKHLDINSTFKSDIYPWFSTCK